MDKFYGDFKRLESLSKIEGFLISVIYPTSSKQYEYKIEKDNKYLFNYFLHHMGKKAMDVLKPIGLLSSDIVLEDVKLIGNKNTTVRGVTLTPIIKEEIHLLSSRKAINYEAKSKDIFYSKAERIEEVLEDFQPKEMVEEETKTNPTKKGETIMKSNIMNKIGNKVENAFAMSMTGGFATKMGSDYYTANGFQLTRVTDFIMGDFSMDGYTMPKAISQVSIGDLVVTDKTSGIVQEIINKEKIVMITAGGLVETFVPVKDFPMLPEAMVLTVMNPMGSGQATDSPSPFGGMNPMMMMMMSKKDGGSDDNSMFKMMAMSQMMAGSQAQGGLMGMFGTPVAPSQAKEGKD